MKTLHYIQHVDFEDPGFILDWAQKRDFSISSTKLYAGEKLPDRLDTDLLVVMGGPMNIYDYHEYPWLKHEKEFLERAIKRGTKIIGICLGAQLLADVLGARVVQGANKEIGWFPIKKTLGAKTDHLFQDFPDNLTAMHWHGDTFDIPKNALSLFTSDACDNQGFMYNDTVIGLQFHIETTGASLDALIKHCGNELVEGIYIQDKNQITSGALSHINKANNTIDALLSKWLLQ